MPNYESMDWYDILPTQKFAPPYRIQYCPKGYVRAKHNHEAFWDVDTCSHAKYAEEIGRSLLAKEKEDDSSVPCVYDPYG